MNDTTLLILGIAAIFLLGTTTTNPATGQPYINPNIININVTLPAQSVIQPTPYPIPTPYRANLCDVAAPYFAAGIACDGAWTCAANQVSCVGNSPTINCGAPLAIAGANQCSALGAQWHCDASNVWCRYA